MEKKKVYSLGYKMGESLAFIFVCCIALIMIALTVKFVMWLF